MMRVSAKTLYDDGWMSAQGDGGVKENNVGLSTRK